MHNSNSFHVFNKSMFVNIDNDGNHYNANLSYQNKNNLNNLSDNLASTICEPKTGGKGNLCDNDDNVRCGEYITNRFSGNVNKTRTLRNVTKLRRVHLGHLKKKF